MNEVLAKRVLGACVLVGATIVLANLLPAPQAVAPPEEHAKRVTYDLRPAQEVAKIEPAPAPVAPLALPPEPQSAPAVQAPKEAAMSPPPKAANKPAPKAKAQAKAAIETQPKTAPAAEVASSTASPEPIPEAATTATDVEAATAPAATSIQPAPANEPTKESWYLQIGVYAVEANAAKSIAKLRKAGLQPHQGTIAVRSGKVYRVRCGPFASQEEADQGKAKAVAIGFKDARVARD
jgi:cell division septation protein DedD